MEPSSWNETLKQIIFHATNPLIKLQFRGWNNSGVSREWHRLGIDQVLKEGLNFPEFFHQNYPCKFSWNCRLLSCEKQFVRICRPDFGRGWKSV